MNIYHAFIRIIYLHFRYIILLYNIYYCFNIYRTHYHPHSFINKKYRSRKIKDVTVFL